MNTLIQNRIPPPVSPIPMKKFLDSFPAGGMPTLPKHFFTLRSVTYLSIDPLHLHPYNLIFKQSISGKKWKNTMIFFFSMNAKIK